MQIHQHPSPNHSKRRGGVVPELVVLHYTAMASNDAALARLCAPEHEVSAHYLIARNGKTFQLVDEARRAWHAGAGSWGGAGDVNSRSIGIELDNDGRTPFSALQMQALETLLPKVLRRWEIPVRNVIGHSDMAPDRKADPGRRFDWRRLGLSGLALWPVTCAGATPDKATFLQTAVAFGYGKEHGFDPIFEAFRQRFRPHHTGALDGVDMGLIAALALDLSPPQA